MKTLIFLFILTTTEGFAAICSCDAAPACGAKPASCYQQLALSFLGNTFVESNSAAPTTLAFGDHVKSSGVIAVSWGSPLQGMPFGEYFVYFTSDTSFRLMLAPFNGGSPQLVEEFTFKLNSYTGRASEIRADDGTLFLAPGIHRH